MTDKTTTDKPITVRIPLDLLEQIEAKASDRYPSRKGTGGNRSQVILDALVFYQSHQWGEESLLSTQSNTDLEVIRDEIKKQLSDEVHDVIQEVVQSQLENITGNLEYLVEKALDERLQGTQSKILDTSLHSVQYNTDEEFVTQSTQNNTEHLPSEDTLKLGLSGRALEIRLGKGQSWVSRNKNKPDFGDRTRRYDPDGFSWYQDGELFYPRRRGG